MVDGAEMLVATRAGMVAVMAEVFLLHRDRSLMKSCICISVDWQLM